MASLQKNPVIVTVQPTDTPQALVQWIPPLAQLTGYRYQGNILSPAQLQQQFQALHIEANAVLEAMVYVA